MVQVSISYVQYEGMERFPAGYELHHVDSKGQYHESGKLMKGNEDSESLGTFLETSRRCHPRQPVELSVGLDLFAREFELTDERRQQLQTMVKKYNTSISN